MNFKLNILGKLFGVGDYIYKIVTQNEDLKDKIGKKEEEISNLKSQINRLHGKYDNYFGGIEEQFRYFGGHRSNNDAIENYNAVRRWLEEHNAVIIKEELSTNKPGVWDFVWFRYRLPKVKKENQNDA